MGDSLRERKKAETRARILEVSAALFHAQGFEATSIEAICAEVGISKRTFFRYFIDKEALVMPNRDNRLARFVQLLDARAPAESPFETLRRVTRVMSAEYTEKRETLLAQQALIQSSPTLLAREREIDADWEGQIARIFLREGATDPASKRRSRILAGAVMGAVRASMRTWYAQGGVDDLDALGQETIDCLERGWGSE